VLGAEFGFRLRGGEGGRRRCFDGGGGFRGFVRFSGGDSGDKRAASVMRSRKVARAAQARRGAAALDDLLHGSPEREIGFKGDALDGFHGGFADAADGGVDDAHEGDGVIGIEDELEVGDHVLDLGALVKAEASDDVVVEVVRRRASSMRRDWELVR